MIAAAIAALAACKPSNSAPTSAVFVVEVARLERFQVRIVDPVRIAQADALLASASRAAVSGRLRRGDGGFNAPYAWHLAPETIRFEPKRCSEHDALPSDLDEDLERWFSELGEYCPWEARIVARGPQ